MTSNWRRAVILAWFCVAFPAWAEDKSELPSLVLETEKGEGAPNEEVDLTRIVVSAVKRLSTVEESPAIVTVVTRREILSRGYQTLDQVLNDIPGFEATRPNYYWRRVQAVVRGTPRAILLLWNGVPLNNPMAVEAVIGSRSFPLSAVDRIEVMSGPGGVLWGANAFLGIVSVTTLDASSAHHKARVDLLAGAGPGLRQPLGASLTVAESFLNKKLQVFANLSVISSRGPEFRQTSEIHFPSLPPPQPDAHTQLRNPSGEPFHSERSLSMPFVLALKAGDLRLDVLYPLVAEIKQPTSSYGVRGEYYEKTDPVTGEVQRFYGGNTNVTDYSSMASLTYDHQAPDAAWRIVGRAYAANFHQFATREYLYPIGQFADNDTVISMNTVGGTDDLLHNAFWRLGSSVDFSFPWRRHDLMIGAEGILEHGGAVRSTISFIMSDSITVVPGDRFISGAFVNDRFRLHKRITIEAGARVQAAQGAGGYSPEPLFSGALLVNPWAKHYLKVNYAEGYRTPGFITLLANNNPETNVIPSPPGNTSLLPEQSRSLDFEYSSVLAENQGLIKQASFRAGYQLGRLDDLIIRNNAFIPVNAGSQTMHTAEVRLEVNMRAARLSAGYSHVTATDSVAGPVRHVANHKLMLGCGITLSKNSDASIAVVVVGPRGDLNRVGSPTSTPGILQAPTTSLVVDRYPPHARLRVGGRLTDLFGGRFDLGLHIDNAWNSQFWIPDHNFENRYGVIPMFGPEISALLTLTGKI